jgi:hypothetical protein
MTMDCKQLHDVLDCYVDGELSPESMASAEAHVHACRNCARAVEHVNALRSQVRRLVDECGPPPDLQRRVQRSLATAWRPRAFGDRHIAWAIATGVVLFVGTVGWAWNTASFNSALASGIDRVALHLHDAGDIDFEATLLCRDCELEKRHGIRALCPTIGHHGALATADGRIWSIVEQPGSTDLIHNSTLLGTKVRAHGRIFRSASSVSVRRYELISPADVTPVALYRQEQRHRATQTPLPE